MERKETQQPRIDRKTLVLTVVAALLVIAIIIIAVVLLQRSRAEEYNSSYEAAMEHYIAGEYQEALDAARRAYGEDATEEAVLIIARSCAALGDYGGAVSALEGWVDKNGSGEEAGALLEKYRTEAEAPPTESPEEETVSIGGESFALDADTVVLSGVSLTEGELEALAGLENLTNLSLNGCGLEDVSALAGCEKLTTLSLEDNAIEDISPLSGLRSLRALYLSGNSLGALEPLYGLDGLATLDIRGREITDEELEALQSELPGCTILTDEPIESVEEITLGGQTFTSDVTRLELVGAGVTDISALAVCTRLEYLDVSYNREIDSISVVAGMPNLRVLDFTETNVSSLSPILALTELEVLWLRNTKVTNISALSGHTSITELELSGNDIEDYSPLLSLTGLGSLILSDAGLEDYDLEILKQMTWLDRLHIENNAALTPEAVAELAAALPETIVSAPDFADVTLGGQMFPVDASQVNASGANVENLEGIERFTGLDALFLNDNPGIDISGLGGAASLTYLELARCELEDISELLGLEALAGLNLMQNRLTDISALRRMSALTELYLDYNEDLEDVSALSGLHSLHTLSLKGTAVTDLSAIAGLTELSTLDIEGCRIESIEPLLGLKNLRTLYAAGCGLSSDELSELGRALPNCTIYT